ncbi:hypothetical protein B0H67DRAFT_554821 [Lasiosphaeris hirsuta]|uniref:Uncharacterized protein n=1 Tax=Lasiosphaeris hirsuta TaxID=260670 RepID=A0AA40A7H2_9PEZI|nr:hypothetical protein B0H67DRAFT_554821 [Lasiosphaeris hirsuta]
MFVLGFIVAALASRSWAAALTPRSSSNPSDPNTVTINTFGDAQCTQALESALLSDQFCSTISSGGFTSFTFTNLNLAAGCRVTFNDDNTCTQLSNPIDVNDSQCFEAVNGIDADVFANVFCS